MCRGPRYVWGRKHSDALTLVWPHSIHPCSTLTLLWPHPIRAPYLRYSVAAFHLRHTHSITAEPHPRRVGVATLHPCSTPTLFRPHSSTHTPVTVATPHTRCTYVRVAAFHLRRTYVIAAALHPLMPLDETPSSGRSVERSRRNRRI